jgi:tetratricopeptide (TPR) repeat protein
VSVIDERLEEGKKSLEDAIKTHGKGHPNTFAPLCHLGFLYRGMGEYNLAITAYQEALEVCRGFLGDNHFHVAVSIGNLASVYADKEDYASGLPLYQEALEIARRTEGNDSTNTGIILYHFGLFYHYQGMYPKALQCYQEAQEIYSRTMGSDHPDATNLDYFIKACHEESPPPAYCPAARM